MTAQGPSFSDAMQTMDAGALVAPSADGDNANRVVLLREHIGRLVEEPSREKLMLMIKKLVELNGSLSSVKVSGAWTNVVQREARVA